ncbi:hypothetical protein T190_26745 [Sinorhizobium meliloti CCBAU 01290]|nr:hypothetical protein T190_26745 [Sinorhizobium meliloti CCBAU 01290]
MERERAARFDSGDRPGARLDEEEPSIPLD